MEEVVTKGTVKKDANNKIKDRLPFLYTNACLQKRKEPEERQQMRKNNKQCFFLPRKPWQRTKGEKKLTSYNMCVRSFSTVPPCLLSSTLFGPACRAPRLLFWRFLVWSLKWLHQPLPSCFFWKAATEEWRKLLSEVHGFCMAEHIEGDWQTGPKGSGSWGCKQKTEKNAQGCNLSFLIKTEYRKQERKRPSEDIPNFVAQKVPRSV